MAEEDDAGRGTWYDAAAVLAVIAVLALAGRQLRPLVEQGAFLARTGEGLAPLSGVAWARAAVWLVAGVAVLVGRTRVAVVAAWAGVAVELAATSELLGRPPGFEVPAGLLAWPVLLAAAAAVLVSVPGAVERGLDLLGRLGRMAVVAAAATFALMAAAVPLLGDVYDTPADAFDPDFLPRFVISSVLHAWVVAVGIAAPVGLVIAALASADRAVRPKAFLLVGVLALGYVLVQQGMMPMPFGL
ncbi:hypothetical protein GCM10009682_38120 [Luedemannella flava]|uniref:Yip1 domain-containing protein n=1 Tax=Luedemannella flava TaxID=349316 RepID=A0ABP4YLG6_9ACTN